MATVKTTGTKKASLQDRSIRLKGIVPQVAEFCTGADLVVIEAPSFGSKFGSPHDRSGLWWLVVDEVIPGIPVAQVSPQGRAKYGTGKGNSKKPVVYAAVKQNYNPILPRPVRNDDEADAVLLAAMGARWLGAPIEPERPGDANCDALAGVEWPSPYTESRENYG